VATRIWRGVEPQVAYLRRLAIVFAVELRITILTELYQREMSPKRFYEQFGGGSLSRVTYNFKVLAEHGWLRYIRSEGPDSSRRGGVEHFYRATGLAVYDNQTWALVPYSMRVAIAWKTFKALAERVREALIAQTLDARPESHLSFTTVRLDQLGWERVIASADALYESLFEEQEDAKLRMLHSDEKPMVATVALEVFESPPRQPISQRSDRATPLLVGPGMDLPVPLPHRISKVIGDEISLKLLSEANRRKISAPLFHAEFGGESVESVRSRLKTLEKFGWIVEVEEKTGGRRRSAKERFYMARVPVTFDNEGWANVPTATQSTFSWAIFGVLAELVKEAIQVGTFEARLEKHQSWSVLRLDQRGWEKVAAAVEALSACVFEEKTRAESRIATSGEAPITTTIGLAAFESPRQVVKKP
jgi:hypothetical protein